MEEGYRFCPYCGASLPHGSKAAPPYPSAAVAGPHPFILRVDGAFLLGLGLAILALLAYVFYSLGAPLMLFSPLIIWIPLFPIVLGAALLVQGARGRTIPVVRIEFREDREDREGGS